MKEPRTADGPVEFSGAAGIFVATHLQTGHALHLPLTIVAMPYYFSTVSKVQSRSVCIFDKVVTALWWQSNRS